MNRDSQVFKKYNKQFKILKTMKSYREILNYTNQYNQNRIDSKYQ